MIISGRMPGIVTFDAAVDTRSLPLRQIPVVLLHRSVMTALGLPDHTLAAVTRGRTATAAWLVGSDNRRWRSCPTPWHSTVRLSAPVWNALGGRTPPAAGERVEITVRRERMPVLPARIERLLAGNEIGLHADDARRLGVRRWAFVNHGGIPALCRVRRTKEERDRGHVRLSYQTRMLLGIPPGEGGFAREVLVAAPPARGRRRLRVREPRWGDRGTRWPVRAYRALGAAFERAAQGALRAPALTFRTLEAATPGEDQAPTVRLAEELFPLLGTQPGKQVYVEWGPGNRTIATALPLGEVGRDDWPDTYVVGRAVTAERPPGVAVAGVGAMSRAALGVPRVAVVTVRRRVGPLIVAKLNELIVPSTALMVALTADIKLKAWSLVAAGVVITALLLAPLRLRRDPRGRSR
ncbi:hypothetical protein [Spirillospora sp. NPDC029432]|uniref:hypothetical protein n=1 Tax=Spirillospora sp. NPDC029432 TaxID=3154599 RepID=UPI003451B41C